MARPDADASLLHIGLVVDTYTILLGGEDAAGCYCLIDMHIPPGGGPAPHRYDFEETFVILASAVRVGALALPMYKHYRIQRRKNTL
jgi:hypothetical protein